MSESTPSEIDANDNSDSEEHGFNREEYVINIKVLMTINGYKSTPHLQRALLKLRCDISCSQINRIVDGKTKSLNLELINALCYLFKCSPGDLFRKMNMT